MSYQLNTFNHCHALSQGSTWVLLLVNNSDWVVSVVSTAHNCTLLGMGLWSLELFPFSFPVCSFILLINLRGLWLFTPCPLLLITLSLVAYDFYPLLLITLSSTQSDSNPTIICLCVCVSCLQNPSTHTQTYDLSYLRYSLSTYFWWMIQSTFQSLAVNNIYLGEGSDNTGVPTKMLTVNGSLRISVYNPATFFGIHVSSTPISLVYSEITVATGQVMILSISLVPFLAFMLILYFFAFMFCISIWELLTKR